MRYIQDIDNFLNENFKLVDLGNAKWFGEKDANYNNRVTDLLLNIAADELGISEKSFSMLDRLKQVSMQVLSERKQEFDAIVHNCKTRDMRPQYAAETAYHTLLQGRLRALQERSQLMGGFKLD